jgi:hypothetical protein
MLAHKISKRTALGQLALTAQNRLHVAALQRAALGSPRQVAQVDGQLLEKRLSGLGGRQTRQTRAGQHGARHKQLACKRRGHSRSSSSDWGVRSSGGCDSGGSGGV